MATSDCKKGGKLPPGDRSKIASLNIIIFSIDLINHNFFDLGQPMTSSNLELIEYELIG